MSSFHWQRPFSAFASRGRKMAAPGLNGSDFGEKSGPDDFCRLACSFNAFSKSSLLRKAPMVLFFFTGASGFLILGAGWHWLEKLAKGRILENLPTTWPSRNHEPRPPRAFPKALWVIVQQLWCASWALGTLRTRRRPDHPRKASCDIAGSWPIYICSILECGSKLLARSAAVGLPSGMSVRWLLPSFRSIWQLSTDGSGTFVGRRTSQTLQLIGAHWLGSILAKVYTLEVVHTQRKIFIRLKICMLALYGGWGWARGLRCGGLFESRCWRHGWSWCAWWHYQFF